MFSLDTEAIRRRMKANGHTVSSLSRLTGLSRQAIHAMFRPGFRALVPGVEMIAEALALEPGELFVEEMHPGLAHVQALLLRARSGDARAFEVIPAALGDCDPLLLAASTNGDSTSAQLLAAALETRLFLVRGTPSHFHVGGKRQEGRLVRWLELQRGLAKGNTRPFYFGADLISEQRLRAETPETLSCHDVYGSFVMDDFRRHMPCN